MATSSSRRHDQVKVKNDVLKMGDVSIEFMRTLRIPDDGTSYPLPVGFGRFPVRRVQDYPGRVPAEWAKHGGVFLPMYQREAMWISFSGPTDWSPRAVKVGVGKVCAVSGAPWSETLQQQGGECAGTEGAQEQQQQEPGGEEQPRQDYVVVPTQRFLDGIKSGDGTVGQFVAMPLGMGYTVEAQVTGEERHGGLQLCVFRPKPGLFQRRPKPSRFPRHAVWDSSASDYGSVQPTFSIFSLQQQVPTQAAPAAAAAAPSFHHEDIPEVQLDCALSSDSAEMGVAAGGVMRQEVYADPHGIDVWEQPACARVFVHLCNSAMWRDVTGEAPPETPVSADTYEDYELAWFDVYDEGAVAVDAAPPLAAVKSVKEMDAAKGLGPQQDDEPVAVPKANVHILQLPRR